MPATPSACACSMRFCHLSCAFPAANRSCADADSRRLSGATFKKVIYSFVLERNVVLLPPIGSQGPFGSRGLKGNRVKIPDSPAAVKLRKIPNISATGPRAGKASEQEQVRRPAKSIRCRTRPRDGRSISEAIQQEKSIGKGGVRTLSPLQGPPHGGDWPSMTAGPRPTATRGRPPTPQALTKDRRRQHRHAAVRPRQTRQPTAAASPDWPPSGT